MKLLVCTQVMDVNDPVLGFMHRWVESFSVQFDEISVICLSEGHHSLPANVRVYSLGKEKGPVSKFAYALRFWKLLKSLRGQYDAVYVHMNPEYVLLGASEWKQRKIKIGLWYNHEHGGWKLETAAGMVDLLFHTSSFAASAGKKQSRKMPVGIDTKVFTPQPVAKKPQSVYFQGRVSPAKRVHILLAAVRLLQKENPDVLVDVVGPLTDIEYVARLKSDFADLFESKTARLLGPVPNPETPALYSEHVASVNLTAAGNFDKSCLEAAACGTASIVSSPALKGLLPDEFFFTEGSAESLAATLQALFAMPEDERESLIQEARDKVVAEHSLDKLSKDLLAAYSS